MSSSTDIRFPWKTPGIEHIDLAQCPDRFAALYRQLSEESESEAWDPSSLKQQPIWAQGRTGYAKAAAEKAVKWAIPRAVVDVGCWLQLEPFLRPVAATGITSYVDEQDIKKTNLVDEEAWGGNLLDILPQLLLLKDDIPVPNVTQPGAKHNISDQLISALAQVRKTKITTFLAHFEMAALHLRWLLDGGHVGANVVEELLKLDLSIPREKAQLPSQLAKYPSWLWQPLYLALLVSPLALFSSQNLVGSNVPYLSMIRIFVSRDPASAPLSLQRAEQRMWEALVSVAGGESPTLALRLFAEKQVEDSKLRLKIPLEIGHLPSQSAGAVFAPVPVPAEDPEVDGTTMPAAISSEPESQQEMNEEKSEAETSKNAIVHAPVNDSDMDIGSESEGDELWRPFILYDEYEAAKEPEKTGQSTKPSEIHDTENEKDGQIQESAKAAHENNRALEPSVSGDATNNDEIQASFTNMELDDPPLQDATLDVEMDARNDADNVGMNETDDNEQDSRLSVPLRTSARLAAIATIEPTVPPAPLNNATSRSGSQKPRIIKNADEPASKKRKLDPENYLAGEGSELNKEEYDRNLRDLRMMLASEEEAEKRKNIREIDERKVHKLNLPAPPPLPKTAKFYESLNPHIVFDCRGNALEFKLRCKAPIDFEAFSSMLSQDVNLGQPSPAHLDETRHSQFAIPDGFTPVEVLDLLQKKHVIIPHSSSQSAPFRESLRSVGYRQSHVTNVKDFTSLTGKLDHIHIEKRFSLDQLATEAEKPLPLQRSLLAMNLPLAKADEQMSKYNSSAVIWEATQMLEVGQGADTVAPIRQTNWAMGNTRDCLTFCHMDESGVVTWVRVENEEGAKIWGVCYWDDEETEASDLASSSLYEENPDLIIKGMVRAKWEFIILLPGDILIMRPGTIHAVYSDRPTVVRGGFMYTFSTMERTAGGLYHMLASMQKCTNSWHLENLASFRRMIGAVHALNCEFDDIPADLATQDVIDHLPSPMSFPDVLSVCYLICILDLAAFHYDTFYTQEGINPDIVLCIRTARRLARHFVWWWDSCYCIFDLQKPDVRTQLGSIFESMVLDHAYSFLDEVTRSVSKKIKRFTPGCTPSNVKEGLTRHFSTPIVLRPMNTRWEDYISSGVQAPGYRYTGSRNWGIKEQSEKIDCPSLDEVVAVTVNDLCPSCLWEPSDDDEKMLKKEYNVLCKKYLRK